MTMYSPLPTEDPSSSPQRRSNSPRTPSPSLNKKLTAVRNWWLLLILFVTLLFLISLNLPIHQAPTNPTIKPMPEKNLFDVNDINLHEEKMLKILEKEQHVSEDKPEHPEVAGHTCSQSISKVGFMKTHKTASSTIQNILMRYGMNSDWNFVMYSSGTHLGPPRNQYSLTRPFSSSWIKNVPWHAMTQEQGYNIFAMHTKWNQQEVQRVLGEGAKYITILRDPVDEFESLYNYVHFEETFKMDLEQFASAYIGGERPIPRVRDYLGRNQQLWDLGMDKEDINNHEAVNRKIKQMDKDFDLVMITEDFDSSIVLLSDVLCWPLANMTSLKLNARKKSAIEELSPKSRKILKHWLWADYMLYEHFKEKLEQQKNVFGLKSLKDDIVKLKNLNDIVKAECVLKVVKNTTSLSSDFVPWSKDVLAFKINESKEFCKYFGISENHFIEYLQKLQMKRLRKWNPGHTNNR